MRKLSIDASPGLAESMLWLTFPWNLRLGNRFREEIPTWQAWATPLAPTVNPHHHGVFWRAIHGCGPIGSQTWPGYSGFAIQFGHAVVGLAFNCCWSEAAWWACWPENSLNWCSIKPCLWQSCFIWPSNIWRRSGTSSWTMLMSYFCGLPWAIQAIINGHFRNLN